MMDNYEVNVLTRKGGWKKLPQEVINSESEFKLNTSENLNINVTDDIIDESQSEVINNNLFENFTEINNIIKKITKNWKMKYKIILTGGYANIFKKIIKRRTIVDQNITIKGVSKVYRKFI